MAGPGPRGRHVRRRAPRERGRAPKAAWVVAGAVLAGVAAASSVAWVLLRGGVPVPVASVSVAGAASGASSRAASGAAAATRRIFDPLPEDLPAVSVRVRRSGPRDRGKRIALTFDLCATPDDDYSLDRKVVDALTRTRTPATFFMGGLWAKAHPKEARELAAVPYFEIGNHSNAHGDFQKMSASAVRKDVMTAQLSIRSITGRTPRTFRYPFDHWGAVSAAQVGDLGLIGVAEDVRTGDPDPNISAKRIVQYVVDVAKPGSIVIMHANGNGVHTAEAMPGLIRGLEREGFEMVTVRELLGIGPAAR